MKKFLFLFLIISTTLQNCTYNECGKLCFTPPNPIQFEFVDTSTGENLFTTKNFNKNDIKIINLVDNSSMIPFTFIDENNYNILSIASIGWETEIIKLSLQVENKEILILTVNAKRLNENCCSFTRFDEIKIENTNFTFNNQKGVYTILID